MNKNGPGKLKNGINQAWDMFYKVTEQNLDFRSKLLFFDTKCAFLADFGHFCRFFEGFFAQKMAKSQKIENSSYRIQDTVMSQDFVRGILIFL